MNMSNSNAGKAIHAIDDVRRDEVLALFQSASWTADRSPAAVDRVIAGSDIVVGVLDSGSNRLVGSPRAITDGVFLAVVLDVIVRSNNPLLVAATLGDEGPCPVNGSRSSSSALTDRASRAHP
jgi:hypothetical protein